MPATHTKYVALESAKTFVTAVTNLKKALAELELLKEMTASGSLIFPDFQSLTTAEIENAGLKKFQGNSLLEDGINDYSNNFNFANYVNLLAVGK